MTHHDVVWFIVGFLSATPGVAIACLGMIRDGRNLAQLQEERDALWDRLHS